GRPAIPGRRRGENRPGGQRAKIARPFGTESRDGSIQADPIRGPGRQPRIELAYPGFADGNWAHPHPRPLPQAEPYPQNWMLDTAGRAQKSEIRNSKSETNPKFESKKTPMNLPDSQELTSGILDFRPFEFVSD